MAGTRIYFFYSDEGLIAEYDASGNELKSYGYQPDSTWTTNPLFLKQNGSYYFYQNDHLGTPQQLVAQNGAVVWSATYSAFGETNVDIETVTNNLRFPGQYFDSETGLHYNWQRYYDPNVGQYIQVDPIGFASGGMNFYEYVRNNPIRFLDFTGFIPIEPYTAFGEAIMKAPGSFLEPTVKSPPLSECVEGLGECIAQKMVSFEGLFVPIPGLPDDYNQYNCADAAIRALIECAAEKNVSLTLPKPTGKTCFRSKDYATTEEFVNAAQYGLHAKDLFQDDMITISRPLESLVPGDLISYNLGHHPGGYTGHTRVVINNSSSLFFFRHIMFLTEIGVQPGDPRREISRWLIGSVPTIDIVEGHLSQPVERRSQPYTYEELLMEWLGPVNGQGRTWNCEIFKECAFPRKCGS